MSIERGADSDPVLVHDILNGFSGRLAFDVGGNIGETARMLATRFDRVVSFEPADESYEHLARLGVPNVEGVQVAVSSHDGALTLAVQEHPIKSGQLTSATENDTSWGGWGRILDSRTVICRTLDDLAAKHGVPDFVKVDVEGHEVEVVKGGLKTLTEHRPDLYIEVHLDRLGDELWDLLEDAYPDLREVQHPHYKPGDWGFDHHYWLVANEGRTA